MAFETIKLVTDSTSDIPPDLLKKWDIAIIPTYVNYGGKSYADDGIELNRDEFYKLLPMMEEFPTTAAPSPGIAEEILANTLANADHIVAIIVPEHISATFNNVRLGAQSLPQEKITIIDSTNYSLGGGLQVLVAAEVAEETGDVKQVVQAVKRVQQYVNFFAVTPSLEYLRRGGRVNALVASVGSLLQIKPILTVSDSHIVSAGRVRTFKKAFSRLRELVESEAPLDRLVIGHTDNETDAFRLLDMLGDIVPDTVIVTEIGPTIGAHLGPGAIGAVTLSQDWRK